MVGHTTQDFLFVSLSESQCIMNIRSSLFVSDNAPHKIFKFRVVSRKLKCSGCATAPWICVVADKLSIYICIHLSITPHLERQRYLVCTYGLKAESHVNLGIGLAIKHTIANPRVTWSSKMGDICRGLSFIVQDGSDMPCRKSIIGSDS